MASLPKKSQLIGRYVTKGAFRAALGQLIDWFNATASPYNLGATTGTDTYSTTSPPGFTTDGAYTAKFVNANTSGAPTLNGKTIKKGSGASLSAGDLTANFRALLYFDGTDLLLLNPAKGVLSGRKSAWVSATSMFPRTTAGATGPNQIETTTNKINFKTLDFDQTTQQYGQFNVAMPKSWDLGTVTATFYWLARAGSGDCIWGLQAVALSDNEAIDTAMGTAQEVTDTSNGVDKVNISPVTAAITIGSSPAIGDDVVFQVYRNAPAGGDTLNATASLIGILFTVNFSGADDSL